AIPETIEQRSMDLLIIGSGPAGLSAAIAAASAGASVTIVDERHSAGGQFYKQPNTSSARRELEGDRQASDGAALIAQALALGVTILGGVTVWGAAHDEDGLPVIGCLG